MSSVLCHRALTAAVIDISANLADEARKLGIPVWRATVEGAPRKR